MNTFGECSVVIGGTKRRLRGNAKITPAGLEVSVEPNADGSVYQTAKTKPVVLEIELEDEVALPIAAADLIASHAVTFVEEHRGVTHILSNAKMHGEPQLDPSSGALSGISFACQRSDYRRIGG